MFPDLKYIDLEKVEYWEDVRGTFSCYQDEEAAYREWKTYQIPDMGRTAQFINKKSKAEASKILDRFIDRVDCWNRGEIGNVKISKAWVFGSFLYKEYDLNDLDVFISLDFHINHEPNFNPDFEREKTKVIDFMFDYVKGGESFLMVHSSSDGVFRRCEKELVYEQDNFIF